MRRGIHCSNDGFLETRAEPVVDDWPRASPILHRRRLIQHLTPSVPAVYGIDDDLGSQDFEYIPCHFLPLVEGQTDMDAHSLPTDYEAQTVSSRPRNLGSHVFGVSIVTKTVHCPVAQGIVQRAPEFLTPAAYVGPFAKLQGQLGQ